MNRHTLQAFAAIGQAIWHCQLFETALIPIFEFFKMGTENGYLEKTGGYVREEAYKQPLKNLVKQLVAKNQISSEVESKLDCYIEARHILVHRWFLQHGWPGDEDAEQWLDLAAHAASVTNQALELTKHFAGYMVTHANPEWSQQNPDEYKRRVKDLFRSPMAL